MRRPVTWRQCERLLESCFHHMPQDLRAKVMRDCPVEYARYCGVVLTVVTDGTLEGTSLVASPDPNA